MPISSTKVDEFIVKYLLPFGLFVQMSGIIWLGRGASISQTYIWLSFPALISVVLNWRTLSRLKDNAMVILIAVLFSWAALSVTWGVTDKKIVDVIKRCLHIALYIYAIYRICEQPKRFENTVLIASGIVAVSAVIAIYNAFVMNDAAFSYRAIRLSSMGLSHFPDLGNFLHPVPAGIYYGFFTTCLYVYLISREQTRQTAIYASLCFILIGSYLLFTWSRGPIVATVAAMALATLVIRNWKSNACLIAGVVMGVAVLWFLQDLIFSEQVSSSNIGYRTGIWKQTIAMTTGSLKTLLAGFGFDPGQKIMLDPADPLFVMQDYALHAHCLPLQMFYNYGIIGFTLFAAIMILTAWYALVGCYRKQWCLPLALGIFGFVAMLTDMDAIINRPSQFWLAIWIPVALSLVQRRNLAQLRML